MANIHSPVLSILLCFVSLLLSGCASEVQDVFSEISTSIYSTSTPGVDKAGSTASLPSATPTAIRTQLPTATPLMPPEILLPEAGIICDAAFNKSVTGGNLVFPLTAFKKDIYDDAATWERFDFIRYKSIPVPHLSPKDPTDSKMLVCVLQDRTYEFSYTSGTKGYSHNWRVRFVTYPTGIVIDERSYSGPKPDSIIWYSGTAPEAKYGDEPTLYLYQYLLEMQSNDLIIFSYTKSFYGAWFSPSGREVSVLSDNDKIMTYSLSSHDINSEIGTIIDTFDADFHQAFDQGRQLAMMQDGQINIMNLETTALLHTFRPDDDENYKDFWIANNNRHLAAIDNNNIIDVWDLESESRIAQLNVDDPVFMATWSADSNKLAVVEENSLLSIWDISTQTWTYHPDLVPLNALDRYQTFITGLAYAPDGSLLALGLRDGSLELRRSDDFSLVDSMRSGSVLALENLVWSNDGSLLAFSSDMDIFIAAISPLTLKQNLDGHRLRVIDLSFSPDGSWLLSRSFDGTIRAWSLK